MRYFYNAMHFESAAAYHVYNRGNNGQQIFFSQENYFYFLRLWRKHILPLADVLAWCLMPNHFHFLLLPKDEGLNQATVFGARGIQALPAAIGKVLSSYTQAINRQEQRKGSLFQQKTKAKLVQEEFATRSGQTPYLVYAIRYVHLNPVSAGLVQKVEHWPYSSYRDYCCNRGGTLCNLELALMLTLGYSFC